MPLFDNQTPEGIRARILERVGSQLQTREGSFLYDVVSPTAFELWRNLMTLEELLTAFYVTPDSGTYLDRHAALLGMTRRAGEQAEALLTFTGTDGTLIPENTAFFTPSGLKFLLTADAVIAGGTAIGLVRGEQIGERYNVAAGEISQILKNISGLTGFVSAEAQGGVDEESDSALYDRIDYRRKNPSTSGNVAHYLQWALSCPGVGAAKVTPIWNGPGTVRVILTDYEFHPADQEVVDSCAAYIETQRPVGAAVTVISASSVSISVTASLTLDSVTTIEQVRDAFRNGLNAYLAQIVSDYFKTMEVADYYVYYSKVAAILAGVEGVVDYSDLLINGGAGNVAVNSIGVPVLEEVTLS